MEGIGLSPAELFMGRRLKTSLPTHADLFKTHGAQGVKEHFQKRKQKEKVYYDKHSSKELPPLYYGNKVTLQHKNKVVQTPEGQKYRRNRRHLNKCRASQHTLRVSAHEQTKELPNTHTSRVSKAAVPCVEIPAQQTQKPAVRTHSGRLVNQPAYLKEYEH